MTSADLVDDRTEVLSAPAALIGDRAVETGESIAVVDPWTDREIGRTGVADVAIVDEAAATARAALRDWSARPVAERAAILRRAADLIVADGDALARTVTAEMGMPITLALATQQSLPATVLRATADAAEVFAWEETVDGATLHRIPSGVVAAITPWNMPVHQIVTKVAAALAAGCTVVLKPSEATPFDAVMVRRYLIDAGLPSGALSIVNGTGHPVGQALSSHAGVDHVSFTGSVGGGRAVAAAAAGSLARTTLELGGKSPAVVLPGADLAAVVPRVVASGLVNSGQACNSTSRLVLPASHADAVEELLRSAVADLVVGDPRSQDTTHGPLSSVQHAERVFAHIEAARLDGARVVAGSGERMAMGDSRCVIAPVVFADLPRDAVAVQEEIFGPVLVVQWYDDVDQAVAIANDSRFGLSAEVWSSDPAQALAVAGRLEVGQVKVNGVRTRERPSVPFGGMKQSGYGRELGSTGIAEFTEIRAVMA